MQIIPIASGKGGVGKSLVAANLSIALAKAGKRVIVADMDIGGSNLHLMLGHPPSRKGIGTFLLGDSTFDEILQKTAWENLRFAPGDTEIPGLTALPKNAKSKLFRRLSDEKSCDFFILDLGAGARLDVVDFFLMSNCGIVVTAPTATAIFNAYVFLKNAVFRMLLASLDRSSRCFEYIRDLFQNADVLQKLSIPRLVAKLSEIDERNVASFRRRLHSFRPRIILNMVEGESDVPKVKKIQLSSREFLGVETELLGVLYRDFLQDHALASKLPIVAFEPKTFLSKSIFRVAETVLHDDEPNARPSVSVLQAAERSRQDLKEKLDYMETVAGVHGLEKFDILEILRANQFEIDRLKNENSLLKSKLAETCKA